MFSSTGNTILVTGGGSGIGRALAEAFHAKGNKVVVTGRDAEKLRAVARANPGIVGRELDLDDPVKIKVFAQQIISEFPDLNVVINNAGIMRPEDLMSGDTEMAEATISTNLLGPIRLNAALLPHLMARQGASIFMVTSGLAYVPKDLSPTYRATKAGIRSYFCRSRARGPLRGDVRHHQSLTAPAKLIARAEENRMFAIIGAAGNVGYSTSKALRDAGMPVRAILRNQSKAAPLSQIGCEVAIADLQNPAALAGAIGDADAVQVILPLSPKAADPVEAMRRSRESLVAALDQARPRRVLAISDYGAHVTDDIGMPSMFHEFEYELRTLGSQTLILRSAEHMHNWRRGFAQAFESGVLPSFQDPVDMEQPTIAAQDLGVIAADLLLMPKWENPLTTVHAEGPRRYSAADVASALSELSGKTIRAQAVPRSQWESIFSQGIPVSLARLLIKTNDAKNRGGLIDIESNTGKVVRGSTELIEALRQLVPSQ